jgi:hypothetical protein
VLQKFLIVTRVGFYELLMKLTIMAKVLLGYHNERETTKKQSTSNIRRKGKDDTFLFGFVQSCLVSYYEKDF